MRAQTLVPGRLQPLRDFLPHGRSANLQQVYGSALTWQPTSGVVRSNRLHLAVAGWHKRASESANASRFSSVPLLIGIPRTCTGAGRAGSPLEVWEWPAAFSFNSFLLAEDATQPTRPVTCLAPRLRARRSPPSSGRIPKVQLFPDLGGGFYQNSDRIKLRSHTQPRKAPARG